MASLSGWKNNFNKEEIMPRIIKGYEFKERQRDSFEEFKSIKFYTGLYGKDNIKILSLTNQFGQFYTDIYVKENTKPINKLVMMFGSRMRFEPI